jgi:opacity protein-like surface antigen
MRRLLILSLVLAVTPALAQEGLGPYIGVGLGQLDYEDGFRSRLDYGDTVSTTSLRGGYRFNDTLAFEGIYGTSGTFGVDFNGSFPNFSADGGITVGGPTVARLSGDLDYIELRVLAHAGHVVFGLGSFSVDISGEMTGVTQFDGSALNPPQLPGSSFKTSLADSENGYTILIGAQWEIGEKWGIRAEYEYFDLSSPADATILGVSMQYGF